MSKSMTDPMREALLPCPMCGGKADYNWDERGEEKARHWYIHCAPDDSFKGCIAHNGRFDRLTDAVQHWNTRAALSQPRMTEELLLSVNKYTKVMARIARSVTTEMQAAPMKIDRAWVIAEMGILESAAAHQRILLDKLPTPNSSGHHASLNEQDSPRDSLGEERERFEEYYMERYGFRGDRTPLTKAIEGDKYAVPMTQMLWEAWKQARECNQ